MQKYHPKTLLSSLSEHLLRALVPWLAGLCWFVWLWGVSLPALAAGTAFGVMLWLCARLLGKKRVAKRESLMRQMIGGELALEKLLLLPPRHAAFQAALWISPEAPVEIHSAEDWQVTGQLSEKPVLVRLIAQHESVPITVQQTVEALRDTCAVKAELCLLCATAPLSREAAAFCETSDPPIHLFDRNRLIRLAGLVSPATDEDLRSIGRRKRRRTLQEWWETVLNPSRAKRYFWYGVGLSLLALLTKLRYYPIPAAICLLLYATSKGRQLWQHRHA